LKNLAVDFDGAPFNLLTENNPIQNTRKKTDTRLLHFSAILKIIAEKALGARLRQTLRQNLFLTVTLGVCSFKIKFFRSDNT